MTLRLFRQRFNDNCLCQSAPKAMGGLLPRELPSPSEASGQAFSLTRHFN